MACTTLYRHVERRLLGSDQHQHDPTDKRRERDGLLGVGGGMDRANSDNLFPARVGDALIGKSDDSQNDQSDPYIDSTTNSGGCTPAISTAPASVRTIIPASSRFAIPSFYRRSVHCPLPRRRGYGGQPGRDDSAVHRAYRASMERCRY